MKHRKGLQNRLCAYFIYTGYLRSAGLRDWQNIIVAVLTPRHDFYRCMDSSMTQTAVVVFELNTSAVLCCQHLF